ncbi:MAG TPA: ferritin-like domain-containing protein [Steroidobacteraceae bacterium]|nr:ferritin-like domain-containing protein [Steroidobacteraceae bacterium]
MSEHISQIKQIRERARQQITEGAVTNDYALDRKKAIAVLNEALATELVCVLRYRFHYFMASGIHSQAVKEEFHEHAREEQEHADWIAERIKQLGGKPEMNPAVISGNSHSEYKEGTSLADMIREDLIAERIAIESYREIIKFFGEKDSTSRRLIERILEKEEEHADEMADLLFAVEPETGEAGRSMYFADEVPGATNELKASATKSGGKESKPGAKPS